MTDEIPPPPQTAPPGKAGWWCAWIFTAVVLPAFMGILAAKNTEGDLYTVWGMGLMGLVLHLVSCWKLRDNSGCLFPFILLGGWLLMAASFFFGCVNNIKSH